MVSAADTREAARADPVFEDKSMLVPRGGTLRSGKMGHANRE